MPKKKKPLKIVFASSVAVDALQPFVDEILDAIAELHGRDKIEAFVSDLSTIDLFFESVPTGRTSPHPFDKSKRCEVHTRNTPDNRRLVRHLSKVLGVPVKLRDYVYDVAIRLRDKK